MSQEAAPPSPQGMHSVAVGNAHGPGAPETTDPEGSHPGKLCIPFRVSAGTMYGHPSGVARRYILRPFQGPGDNKPATRTHDALEITGAGLL
jgi:hypothetical protein